MILGIIIGVIIGFIFGVIVSYVFKKPVKTKTIFSGIGSTKYKKWM
jgi:multisubunit Na+/H+ antiporter MnhE subunit